MRADWNERAGEDAYYYVAFGRREQDDEEFFATGADVVKGLEWDLKRLRGRGLLWIISAAICPISSLLLLSFAPKNPTMDPQWFALFVGSVGIDVEVVGQKAGAISRNPGRLAYFLP